MNIRKRLEKIEQRLPPPPRPQAGINLERVLERLHLDDVRAWRAAIQTVQARTPFGAQPDPAAVLALLPDEVLGRVRDAINTVKAEDAERRRQSRGRRKPSAERPATPPVPPGPGGDASSPPAPPGSP